MYAYHSLLFSAKLQLFFQKAVTFSIFLVSRGKETTKVLTIKKQTTMKRLFLHIKRIFRKFWFLIFFAWAISFVFGIALIVVMTVISMTFFKDPVDIKGILQNFTEEQLDIIFAEEVDENVSDVDYFTILARYQTFLCPKKLDRITTWVCSEVNDEAYIQRYELKKMPEDLTEDELKRRILARIDKNGVAAKRAVRSNRSLNFEYTNSSTGESFAILITADELK